MYHCGTPPVIHHIANGMYGAIVVSSPDLKPVAKEYVLVQSEFYVSKGADGLFHTDRAKMNSVTPDYVVFNGYADQYKDAPLTANPGDRIRIWVVNAGPTTFSAFHVIGAVLDAAYADGNPKNEQHGMQSVTIPPGGGYMVELVIPEAGLYPFVTHSFAYTGKGARGLIKVGDGGASAGLNADTSGMSH
jgi:nitrite reductase (NO-forming)